MIIEATEIRPLRDRISDDGSGLDRVEVLDSVSEDMTGERQHGEKDHQP